MQFAEYSGLVGCVAGCTVLKALWSFRNVDNYKPSNIASHQQTWNFSNTGVRIVNLARMSQLHI
jgi:hypothetical protein